MEIKRALLSVSDKENIIDLAKYLTSKNVEIISSGGTRKHLEAAGIKVTPIESVTGNPEAFGGRMKTLSFQISSALLFRRDNQEDLLQAKELEINPIDLVVCNLYPFDQVLSSNGSWDELIENIDIGGPTMVRAAAKNYQSVVCLTHPDQYVDFISKDSEGLSTEDSLNFALAAFSHTAQYDSMIAASLKVKRGSSSTLFHGDLEDETTMEVRYGENPHQKGFIVLNKEYSAQKTLANAPCLQGKALSYNNYLDSDASWRCNSDLYNTMKASEFPYCVTVVKHSNPCGASASKSSFEALEKAWAGDPISSFGSIITFSHKVDKACADFLCERFVEVIIAPSFDKDALAAFETKKNLRLIELAPHEGPLTDKMVRTIYGGFAVQEEDSGEESDIQIVTEKQELTSDAIKTKFGIKVCKHLKSNAIVLIGENANGISIAGAGMGNPNRLVSVVQASEKAKENGFKDGTGLLLVSDAFFPFRDNIDLAHSLGIKQILQPGGSIKDKEVIGACNEFGISMGFTGMRHFRH